MFEIHFLFNVSVNEVKFDVLLKDVAFAETFENNHGFNYVPLVSVL